MLLIFVSFLELWASSFCMSRILRVIAYSQEKKLIETLTRIDADLQLFCLM